ncbi:MAG: glycoside hydrolase family 130 protein [Verrucomicrobiota bacterium JB024]|jgi:beta-1,4-mannooligosaccharide/beta-1,4-mannosyl-N-acetylglucosamine phosphorylase|nr:glycoside hydrolase family 130 protein [Verrucomicrobiota bacterium JB024]
MTATLASPKTLLQRHPANPLLAPTSMPIPCSAVFNSGAVSFDGKVLLLMRVEDLARDNHFHIATSEDGVHFEVSEEPIEYPLRETEEKFLDNRFDMRITPLEGTYYVSHASWLGGFGCCSGLARTDDFRTLTAVGELSVPSNRNAALFPEKINGRYARLERPQDIDGSGRIWVSYSPDLIYWGDAQPILLPKTPWSRNKSGPGAVPIKTDKGWLCIYHAVADNCATSNYYLGVMLLDLDQPHKVLAAPRQFILQPEMPYECMGQVPNVVFTNGAVVMPDGMVNVYYGGADTCVCLAQVPLDELLEFCLTQA